MKHMGIVGIRALKQNASGVVAEAAAGETITITDRGRPVAQLSPLPSSALSSMLLAGHGRPARRNINQLDSPTPGPKISDELAAMRDEERY